MDIIKTHVYSKSIKIYLIGVLALLSFTATAKNKQDSLGVIWKNTANIDTVRLWALDRICDNFFMIHPDTVIYLSQQEYDFAKQRGHKKFMARALLKKASAYMALRDIPNCLYYNRIALILTKELHHKKGIANCITNIGTCYKSNGDQMNALRCYFTALSIYRMIPNGQEGIAVTLSNLAGIYQLNGRMDSAISQMKQSLAIYNQRKDPLRIASALHDLGKLYYHNLQMDLAADHLERSVLLYEQIGAKLILPHVYNELAKVYLNEKKYPETKELIYKSLAISEPLKDSAAIAQSFMVLSNVVHCLGDKAKALELGNKAMMALKNQNMSPLVLNQAIYMAMWYAEAGKYPTALEMYEYYIQNRNAGNDTVRQELFRQQVKYDFEKKELTAKAESGKKLNQLRSEAEHRDFQKNLWLTVFIALLFILAISAFFIYHNFRQRNVIATQKNNLLKQQLLVSQMNPHFIFNSLNAVQNFIFKQDSYQAGAYLKQFSELVRMILDFSRKDYITLEEEVSFLENYLRLQKLRFDSKLNYEIKIDEQLDRESVLVAPMLAQPFIENAIEHGIFYKDGEGFLSVKISFKDNTLIYEIEDNGIGLEAAMNMKKEIKVHKSLAIEITKERLETMSQRSNRSFTLEITDKFLKEKKSGGVYVKFATPYLTL